MVIGQRWRCVPVLLAGEIIWKTSLGWRRPKRWVWARILKDRQSNKLQRGKTPTWVWGVCVPLLLLRTACKPLDPRMSVSLMMHLWFKRQFTVHLCLRVLLARIWVHSVYVQAYHPKDLMESFYLSVIRNMGTAMLQKQGYLCVPQGWLPGTARQLKTEN